MPPTFPMMRQIRLGNRQKRVGRPGYVARGGRRIASGRLKEL
jgi:hypothetical protein